MISRVTITDFRDTHLKQIYIGVKAVGRPVDSYDEAVIIKNWIDSVYRDGGRLEFVRPEKKRGKHKEGGDEDASGLNKS